MPIFIFTQTFRFVVEIEILALFMSQAVFYCCLKSLHGRKKSLHLLELADGLPGRFSSHSLLARSVGELHAHSRMHAMTVKRQFTSMPEYTHTVVVVVVVAGMLAVFAIVVVVVVVVNRTQDCLYF